jgi:hypothetical protein
MGRDMRVSVTRNGFGSNYLQVYQTAVAFFGGEK